MKSKAYLLSKHSTRSFSKFMKAIVCDGFGGPEVMKVSDQVELPEVKGN